MERTVAFHGRTRQRRRSAVVIAALAAALTSSSFAGGAEQSDAAAMAYGQRLAIGVCGTCHGARGNSEQPKFPRLAGQNANYLAAQLKNFRAQTRDDPDAIGYMWGMAGELSDTTIDALAHFYSAQPLRLPSKPQSAEVSRGREIYERGIESEGVPACSACHAPDAHGMAEAPRLAGQHAPYVLKQLVSFQSNLRNVTVMQGVVRSLSVTQMRAVAVYLEAQP